MYELEAVVLTLLLGYVFIIHFLYLLSIGGCYSRPVISSFEFKECVKLSHLIAQSVRDDERSGAQNRR